MRLPALKGTRAIDPCLVAAADEAWRQGERKIGTDHLVLGLLHDETAAGLLGSTPEQARAAVAALDEEALGALGLTLPGLPAAEPPRRKRPAMIRNQASAGMRAVISRAVRLNGGRAGGLTPVHLLRAVLEQQAPDPAAVLLGRLGVDAAALRVRLEA
jgi:hypothetical protein